MIILDEQQIVPSVGVMNSMTDIREFLMASDPPLQPGEFAEFWKSLTEEERTEFKNTPLK